MKKLLTLSLLLASSSVFAQEGSSQDQDLKRKHHFQKNGYQREMDFSRKSGEQGYRQQIVAPKEVGNVVDQKAEFVRNNQAMEEGFDHMQEKMANLEEKKNRMEERKKRFENASPEEKARMERRHEMMEGLSEEQRKAVKQEMERHRAEMKRITGRDLPMQKPQGEGQR